MNSISPSTRSDAKANRSRLIEAASEALTADPAASLNSIAKAAGVGAGTLYRHFPTRDALVVAVNRAEVESLQVLAHDLTQIHPPIEAFRLWCYHLIDYVIRQRGFAETLRAAHSLAEQEVVYRPVRDSIAHLLSCCEAENAIAPGHDPSDVQLLLSFIWQVRTNEGERRAHSVIDLVIRGLTARA